MTRTTPSHELVTACADLGLPLCAKLTEMLDEHFSHCTERRGCGFTQATRVISAQVNQPRDEAGLADLEVLLAEPPVRELQWLLAQAGAYDLALPDWRHLDRHEGVSALLKARAGARDDYHAVLDRQACLQRAWRSLMDCLEREESRLLAGMMVDLMLPVSPEDMESLASLPEKPKVGSCTMAEKFFLEIVHGALPRKGRVNIIVDHAGQPVLLEKINIGDSHSCISLAPLIMHGVRIPPGSLFATAPADPDNPPPGLRPCRALRGVIMPLQEYPGFHFLRLTTLAVPPAIRARAFGAHFAWQGHNGVYGYSSVHLRQFVTLAQDQL